MSTSSYFVADSTFSSNYWPSDNTSSFVNVEGTTLRIAQHRTPSGSSDTGIQGEICYDNNYFYVCVGNDTWKRCALFTF